MMRKLWTSITTAMILLAFSAGSVFAAKFDWANVSVSQTVGSTVDARLGINTEGKNTTGADVVLTFDTSAVEIVSVTFPGGVYDSNYYNINGATLKLTSSFANVVSTFNGSKDYAVITLKPKTASTSTLVFTCQQGATNDTNILESLTGSDLVTCSQLQTVSITGTQSSSGSQDQNTNTNQNQNQSQNNTSGGGTTNNQASCPALGQLAGLSARGVSTSSILLSWQKTNGATHYAIQYGTKAGSYTYGVGNTGNTDQFIISYLKPNQQYFFSVSPQSSCAGGAAATISGRTLAASGTGAPSATLPPTLVGVPSLEQPLVAGAQIEGEPEQEQLITAIPDETIEVSTPPVTAPSPFSNARILGIAAFIVLLIVIATVVAIIRLRKPPEDFSTPTPPSLTPPVL